ncbi:hypothetical protein ACU4GD_19110 [Cupriavidus basilensis]
MSTDKLFADLRCEPDALEAALRVIPGHPTIRFALELALCWRPGAHGVLLRDATGVEPHADDPRRNMSVSGAATIWRCSPRESAGGQAQFNMLHAHGDDISVRSPGDVSGRDVQLARPPDQAWPGGGAAAAAPAGGWVERARHLASRKRTGNCG